MNNGNVLSQGECCSYRVCILNRIIRRRGFVCNDSTKHLKLLRARVKVILDEVALQPMFKLEVQFVKSVNLAFKK